jgi:DNA primase
VGPRSFTLRTMETRVASAGDLWGPLLRQQQSLKPAVARLGTRHS